MKLKTFTLRTNLLSKLLLSLTLLIGSADVWADGTIFDGAVESGWTYQNSAGTTQYPNSNNELYDGGGTYSPKNYTSNSSITISSDQTINIQARRSSKSIAPSIKVKYSSDNGLSWIEAAAFDETSMTSTTDNAELIVDNIEGSYRIRFEFTYVYISSIILTDMDPYPAPSSFTLDGFTATTATLSWTDGSGTTPDSWQLAYSTTKDFDPASPSVSIENSATRSKTLTGLETGTPYYARVRAYYAGGGGNYSTWTDQLEFTPRAELNITINEGTHTVTTVPIYGGQAKNYLISTQYIVPASDLVDMQNRQITKLTYYASASSINWDGAKFEVYLKITNSSSFPSSPTLESWGTNVFNEGSLRVSEGKMVVEFDTPFNYQSGNLLIGFKQIEKSNSNAAVSWYGSDTYTAGIGMYSYGATNTRISYPLKVTITSVPIETAPVKIDGNGVTTFASPWALDLTAATQSSLGLTAYKASVDAGNSKVLFTSGIDQNVSANTGLLLSGTPNETYLIPVAESGTALADNALLVNDGTLVAESGYTYYALKKNSDPLVFGTFDPSTVVIPSNKAYVKVATGGGVKEFTCEFENATAVQGIKEAQPAVKGAVYDLSGRRVASAANAQLPKGLYIIDGKKVVIK